MRITAIPQLYRNLQRWREILAVMRRYGLAGWLSHFPRLPGSNLLKDREGVPLAQYTREQRIRMALTELGPTFIKLGQLLSARPDLVGPSLAGELRRLHADVAPDPPEAVLRMLEAELGAGWREQIVRFDPLPMATASIGQVHGGALRDGRSVVIKVQRTGIEQTVHRDLDVLIGLAQLAQHVPGWSAWGPAELARQMVPMLRRELDFDRERDNLLLFEEFFADNRAVRIPAPVDALCTRRVLVMDRLDGPSVAALHVAPDEAARLARRIATCYMQMIFTHGVFHADPHPGNLVSLGGGRLGILDFGMVGRIDDRLRESIDDMLMAIAAGDNDRLTRLIKRAGRAPVTLDESALAIDVADFLGTYGRQSLRRFNLTAAINDLSGILHRHGIQLPNQSALLMKMLASLEGTLRALDAEFSALEVMRSFVRRALVRRLSPRRRVRQARRIYLEAEHFLEVVPDQIIGLMDQVRRGRVAVQLQHQRLGPSINRLVLGMLASSLLLGSSLLLAFEVPPLLFEQPAALGLHRLSLLGITGAVTSILVMLRLLRAIGRSGHLDRPDAL